jgi:hypothetical protein
MDPYSRQTCSFDALVLKLKREEGLIHDIQLANRRTIMNQLRKEHAIRRAAVREAHSTISNYNQPARLPVQRPHPHLHHWPLEPILLSLWGQEICFVEPRFERHAARLAGACLPSE